ncbi:uncharacterized protein RJT21DRAFT_125237 [Scheffersomyces amazonensis]|uniref:uncharacterized protein n=1 Tax=Scheffersomyces amazonensis TaxID=1078765 RepID=UPI00315D5C4F
MTDQKPILTWKQNIASTYVATSHLVAHTFINMVLNSLAYNVDLYDNPTNIKEKLLVSAFYLLATSLVIWVSGSIADLIGHRRLFNGGWSLTCLFSFISGVSLWYKLDYIYLLSRILLGISGTFIVPCILGLYGGVISDVQILLDYSSMSLISSGVFGALLGDFLGSPVPQSKLPIIYLVLTIVSGLFAFSSTRVFDGFDGIDGSDKFNLKDIKKRSLLIDGILSLVFMFFVARCSLNENFAVTSVVTLCGSVSVFVVFQIIKYSLFPKALFSTQIGLYFGSILISFITFGVFYSKLIMNIDLMISKRDGAMLLMIGVMSSYFLSAILYRLKPSSAISISSICFILASTLMTVFAKNYNIYTVSFSQIYMLFWHFIISLFATQMYATGILSNEYRGRIGSLISTILYFIVSIFLASSNYLEIYVEEKAGKDAAGQYSMSVIFGIYIAAIMNCNGHGISHMYNMWKLGKQKAAAAKAAADISSNDEGNELREEDEEPLLEKIN